MSEDCCGNDCSLPASVEISGVTGWTPEYIVLAGVRYVRQDPPPDGFPSWEDWLAARGFSIILEQASEERRSWQVFDFDGEIGEPHPDYPAALAAAMKEAGDA